MVGSSSPARSVRLAVAVAAATGHGLSASSSALIPPVVAIIPLGSPDLSTPSVKDNGQSSDEPAPLFAQKPVMVWVPFLSEFVLNRLVELVNTGVCFNMVFKEQHMKKVADDLLKFCGSSVSTLQIYNNIRKWRTKWSVITRLMLDVKLQWSEHGCCFYVDDEQKLIEYLKRNLRHHEYLNNPITYYAQMKTIFTPRFVCKEQLHQPHFLVKALNFIVVNKEEYEEYRGMEPGERRTWLRKKSAA